MGRAALVVSTAIMVTSACGYEDSEVQQSAVVRSEAVYWSDDRLDRYQLTDSTILARFDSVAAMVYSSRVTDNGNGTFTIQTEAQNAGDLFDLCSGERYRTQPVTKGQSVKATTSIRLVARRCSSRTI